MSDEIKKTILYEVRGTANTAALDAATEKVKTLAKETEKANTELKKADADPGVKPREKDGFEKLLEKHQKDKAALPKAEEVEGTSNAVGGLITKLGLATAGAATLAVAVKAVLSANPELIESAKKLGATLSDLFTGASKGAGLELPKVTALLDGLSVALGGNTNEADTAAKAMTGYTDATTTGQQAIEEQKKALDELSKSYKEQGDEIERVLKLKTQLTALDKRGEDRAAVDENAAIDALPDSPEKDRLKTGQKGLEDARTQARKAEQDDAARAAEVERVDLANAKAEELSKKEKEQEEALAASKRLALRKVEEEQAAAKLKDAQTKRTAASAGQAVKNFLLPGSVLGNEDPGKADETDAADELKKAKAATQAARDASRKAGTKGSPAQEQKRLDEIKKEADEARKTAAKTARDAEDARANREGQSAEDDADYQQREGSRADQQETSKEGQRAKRRNVQEMEAQAEEERQAKQRALEANSNLKSGVAELNNAHARNTGALAREVQGMAKEVGGALNETQRQMQIERERIRRERGNKYPR